MKKLKLHACCFFGQRKIKVTDELISRLEEMVEVLIIDKKTKKHPK